MLSSGGSSRSTDNTQERLRAYQVVSVKPEQPITQAQFKQLADQATDEAKKAYYTEMAAIADPDPNSRNSMLQTKAARDAVMHKYATSQAKGVLFDFAPNGEIISAHPVPVLANASLS
jgi:hypothetical protein